MWSSHSIVNRLLLGGRIDITDGQRMEERELQLQGRWRQLGEPVFHHPTEAEKLGKIVVQANAPRSRRRHDEQDVSVSPAASSVASASISFNSVASSMAELQIRVRTAARLRTAFVYGQRLRPMMASSIQRSVARE